MWTYPLLADAMAEVGLQEVETYVSCFQNTVANFNVTRTIMYLCLAAERRPGPWVSKRWWEKKGVDVEGMRTASWEVERTKGEDETDGKETETD